MAKRKLTPEDEFYLRQSLHVAVLDALMASRRWAPGDLVFQGGTSLCLAHGSPRVSEDLDFLVNASLDLASIQGEVEERLKKAGGWIPPDTHLSVSKAKDGRNPHSFFVTIGGENVIGALRVRIEMWQTPESVLSAIKVVVAPVRLTSGAAAGMVAHVPTAELSELYADKVFALAVRSYFKPRDVFDIYWLNAFHGLHECSAENMRVRLTTYPNVTAAKWIEKADERRLLLSGDVNDVVANELKKWLPSVWSLDKKSVNEMLQYTERALAQGIDVMRAVDASVLT
jgi:predicted nucleotidyltransferase component of viral defense system